MNSEKWTKIPDETTLTETIEAIESRGITVILVENKTEALDQIKILIKKGSEVMNGSSTTLNEIGFTDYLKSGEHGWNSVHEAILNEKDQDKQADLRRKSVSAEYFLGSVNAISKTGELVACDASGSRVSAYPFAAKNLILVSGVNKITDSLEEAIIRVREYAYPLEDERAQKAYGMSSTLGKWVILEKEINPGRITLILIKGKFGF